MSKMKYATFFILLTLFQLLGNIAVYSNNKNSHIVKIKYNNEKAVDLIKRDKYGEAMLLINDGLDSINKIINSGFEKDENALKLKMELQYNLALCMAYYDMYDEAIENIVAVLEVADKLDINHLIAGKSLLGTVMMRRSEMKLARRYLNEALSFIDFKRMDKDKNAYGVFNNLASFFTSQKEYDSALYYYSLSLKYCEMNNMANEEIIILRNIGSVYYFMSKYDIAEDYVNKAFQLNKKNESIFSKAMIYHDLAAISIKRKEYQKALEYANKSLEISESTEFSSLKYANYITRAKIYRKLHRYSEAYDDLYKGLTLKDSVFSERKDDKMLAIVNNYNKSLDVKDKAILERDLELSRLDNSRKNMMFGIFFIMFIAVVVIAIYVSRRLFKQHKINRGLSTLISKIKGKEINYLNSINDSDNSTGHNDREFITETLINTRNIEIVKEIKNKLDLITQDNASLDSDKDNVIREINFMLGQLNSGNKWEEFKLYFERIHPLFYQKLISEQPDLTQNELRLCAFIFMNMSTKEIASMLNRSVRTIESAKFRLRKKLNIETNRETREAILEIITKSVVEE